MEGYKIPRPFGGGECVNDLIEFYTSGGIAVKNRVLAFCFFEVGFHKISKRAVREQEP